MEIKNLFEVKNYEEKFYIFLKKVDKLFKTPISNKVSFDEYINKIKKLANSYVVLENNEIIGGIVFYKNNLENKTAYIALVGTLKRYQNRGVAKLLLKVCISDIENSIMEKVGIHTDNIIAKKIYEKNGFKEILEINGRYYLEKKLKQGENNE